MANSHEEEIDLKGVFDTLLRYKRSILIITAVTFFLSVIYAYLKPNVYQAEMTIEVHSGSKQSDALAMLNATLGMSGSSSLDNEIAIIQSRSVAVKALQNLSLGTQYYVSKRFKDVELYQNSPIAVKTYKLEEQVMGEPIHITPIDADRFEIAIRPGMMEKLSYSLRSMVSVIPENKKPITFKAIHRYGERIKTPFMEIVVNQTAEITESEYIVTIVPDELMYGMIQSGLSVSTVAQEGELLALSYNDAIPERAEAILNTIAEAYSQRSIDLKHEIADKKLKFIDRQITAIDESLAKSASNLKEYKTQNEVIDLTIKAKTSVQKIEELKNQRYELEMQESVLENLLSYLKNNTEITGIDLSGLGSGGASILSLIQKIQAANIEQSSLMVDFTDKHPAVLKINQQITSLKANLRGTIESSLRGIRQRVTTLDGIIAANNNTINDLPEEERQLTRLIGSFKFNEKMYEFLLQQRSETAIADASVISDVRIIDSALAYDVPVQPKRKLLVLVGLILGLIIGIAQAFVRNYLTDTIESLHDIEKNTYLAIYSILPYFKEKKSLYEDALRVLLTKFEFSETKPQVITITSSVRGEGRTTTAIELARVMGQSGKRVVLLDMDMRGSAINHKLHLGDAGMSTILSGKEVFENVVHYVAPNTDMVTAGTVPSNPYELMISERFNELLAALRAQYDYIILESPPAGLVADALVLMRISDLNLIIMKKGYSKKGFLTNLNRFIQEHELHNVGIVLNGLELNKIRPWRKK